jgi:DNA (cytosine-5)-methyltransferase 1
LDLGLETAGLRIAGCVEVDADCRRTLAHNRPEWKLAEPGDIHSHHPQELLETMDLAIEEVAIIAAGPPCQPFSKSGYWVSGDSKGLSDPRANTLRASMAVVAAARPQVVLIENVEGFSFKGKDQAVTFIRTAIADINARHHTNYVVQQVNVDAAAYGVPQRRRRVLIIAEKEGRLLQLPQPTHGDPRSAEEPSKGRAPWTTAWDAIGALDGDEVSQNLVVSGKWADLLPSIPEGRNYSWHTARGGGEPLFGWRTKFWTFLLKLAKGFPSWTVQAQPGPATGPFHWRNRLLSVEELCRLQTLPFGYEVQGSYHSARRQLGNGVPSAIGELVGLAIRRQFFAEQVRGHLELIPTRRNDCPPPEPIEAVPAKYYSLRGEHSPHPGPGLGPAAALRSNGTVLDATDRTASVG